MMTGIQHPGCKMEKVETRKIWLSGLLQKHLKNIFKKINNLLRNPTDTLRQS